MFWVGTDVIFLALGISLLPQSFWPFGQKEYAQKAVFCFCNKSSYVSYVRNLYQGALQYIPNWRSTTIKGTKTQTNHGVRAVGHGIGEIDIPAKMARLAKSLSQE